MTEDEWILARLQVEREQRMCGWSVPGPQRERKVPAKPRAALAAAEARKAQEAA